MDWVRPQPFWSKTNRVNVWILNTHTDARTRTHARTHPQPVHDAKLLDCPAGWSIPGSYSPSSISALPPDLSRHSLAALSRASHVCFIDSGRLFEGRFPFDSKGPPEAETGRLNGDTRSQAEHAVQAQTPSGQRQRKPSDGGLRSLHKKTGHQQAAVRSPGLTYIQRMNSLFARI